MRSFLEFSKEEAPELGIPDWVNSEWDIFTYCLMKELDKLSSEEFTKFVTKIENNSAE